jgi:hypothetical protein
VPSRRPLMDLDRLIAARKVRSAERQRGIMIEVGAALQRYPRDIRLSKTQQRDRTLAEGAAASLRQCRVAMAQGEVSGKAKG